MDGKIKIFNDFKETTIVRPDFTPEGIHGKFIVWRSWSILGDGPLLAVRGKETIAFYDWDKGLYVSQIDGIEAKDLFWSQNGTQLIISTESSYYKLKYNQELVSSFFDNASMEIPEEGIEEAFTVSSLLTWLSFLKDAEEVMDKIRTGIWARDCFLYTNSANKLNYCVGNLVETISHLDRFVREKTCF